MCVQAQREGGSGKGKGREMGGGRVGVGRKGERLSCPVPRAPTGSPQGPPDPPQTSPVHPAPLPAQSNACLSRDTPSLPPPGPGRGLTPSFHPRILCGTARRLEVFREGENYRRQNRNGTRPPEAGTEGGSWHHRTFGTLVDTRDSVRGSILAGTYLDQNASW